MERCRVRTMYGLQAVYLYEIANIPTDTGIIGSKYAEIYLKLANGFCSEVVTEKDHPDTVSVSQSLNRTFSFKELERTIGYLCTEMLDKLRRERDRHSREPSTLKLIIETDNGDWYFAFAIDRRNGICLPDLMTQLADNFWATNSKYWYPNGKVYKGSVTAKFN